MQHVFETYLEFTKIFDEFKLKKDVDYYLTIVENQNLYLEVKKKWKIMSILFTKNNMILNYYYPSDYEEVMLGFDRLSYSKENIEILKNLISYILYCMNNIDFWINQISRGIEIITKGEN